MRICAQCGQEFAETVQFCPNDGSKTSFVASQPPPPNVDPLIGRVIDGRYRIEKALGEGGMGVVYLATHAALNKRCALKVLKSEYAKNEEVVQRFQQEAQSATSIGHPNIIDISDFGKLPDGSVFFVMEYLDGLSLSELLEQKGALEPELAINILLQITSALDAAHTRGIVHRDMKPDNIYLGKRPGQDYFVKVLDFGIAKVGGASSKLTKTGMIFGTPHYMSPEQASGQGVDRRTDIYALGIIMYEIFTGKVPFDGDTFMGILTAHMFQNPEPPSAIDSALGPIEAVIMRAIAKKAEDRYQTMNELAADLERVRIGDSPTMPPPAKPVLGREPSGTQSTLKSTSEMMALSQGSKKGPLVWLAGTAVLIGAAGGVVLWMNRGPTPAAATDNPVANVVPPNPINAIGSGPTNNGSTPTPPTVAIAPPPAPSNVFVSIESTPPGAEILVNGVTVGNTPGRIPRPESGSQTVELRLHGFQHGEFDLSPASPESVVVTLNRRRTESGPRPAHEGTPDRPPAENRPTKTAPRTEIVDPWQT